MDIAELVRKQSQPIADARIGRKKVYLYALRSGDISSISKLSDEEKSLENFKSLIRIISSHKKPDNSNKRTPPTEEFIHALSQEDMNKLAEVYLETSYVKKIVKELKIPLQKNVSEESSQYLYRILKLYIKEDSESTKALFESTLNPFHNVREASLNLGKKIDAYDLTRPIIEQARTAHLQRKQELEMAKLTAEMSKESANLLNKLTIDVTNFLLLWRTETNSNNHSTKIQLTIALVSLIVSLLFSGFALYYSYKSYEQDNLSAKESDETNQKIIKLLSEANENSNALLKQNSSLELRVSDLIENQKNEQQTHVLPSQKIKQ